MKDATWEWMSYELCHECGDRSKTRGRGAGAAKKGNSWTIWNGKWAEESNKIQSMNKRKLASFCCVFHYHRIPVLVQHYLRFSVVFFSSFFFVFCHPPLFHRCMCSMLCFVLLSMYTVRIASYHWLAHFVNKENIFFIWTVTFVALHWLWLLCYARMGCILISNEHFAKKKKTNTLEEHWHWT